MNPEELSAASVGTGTKQLNSCSPWEMLECDVSWNGWCWPGQSLGSAAGIVTVFIFQFSPCCPVTLKETPRGAIVHLVL